MTKLARVLVLVAAALGGAVAQASSPEPPVQPSLEVVKEGRTPKGRQRVRLHLKAKHGDYAVEIRNVAAPPETGQERGRGKVLARGRVNYQDSMTSEHEIEVSGPVTHARYEIEVQSDDGQHHDVVVVDQAFGVAADGSLEPIDFAEAMRRRAGKPPVALGRDDAPAAGASSTPTN